MTPAELDEALAGVPRWRFDPRRRAIVASYAFPDFGAAWAFMTRVALSAERRDHHPDWSNVYGRVEIALTTHDAGGVTARDIDMAAEIEAWGIDA